MSSCFLFRGLALFNHAVSILAVAVSHIHFHPEFVRLGRRSVDNFRGLCILHILSLSTNPKWGQLQKVKSGHNCHPKKWQQTWFDALRLRRHALLSSLAQQKQNFHHQSWPPKQPRLFSLTGDLLFHHLNHHQLQGNCVKTDSTSTRKSNLTKTASGKLLQKQALLQHKF